MEVRAKVDLVRHLIQVGDLLELAPKELLEEIASQDVLKLSSNQIRWLSQIAFEVTRLLGEEANALDTCVAEVMES